ncbi:uncharacterized protein LOC124683291 [Lolium rigidum]|uniref:uncharacterized protein LOC124683291 n=1 Tax=Lolium rigidum TaxID=89674 RepID=UPI001F5E0786|nr:uncharacterized protein LOC124683291 [Lolium rigidum]
MTFPYEDLAAELSRETDEQPPLKIQRTDPPTDVQELVKGMDACKLDDLHRQKLKALMVYDPKRKCDVPSRFCSIHLACFDLDEKSTAKIGPRYERDRDPLSSTTRLTKYVVGNTHYELADYSTQVISIRVVKVGPAYKYPVEVYGTVIARDEIDCKCVYLFNRERKDAQTIKSKKDMLALTGPYRALVTLGYMYFEFDLKTKGKNPDDEVQFSKGVIVYYFNPDRRRIIDQLPSFQSTVKLVLEHVKLPVAAILKVSVENKETNDPLVHWDGKITAGTTKNYRHHMVLYDSSVRSGNLVGENGSLLLNRNLVAVNGYPQGHRGKEDEILVLYVCFLDASCEIEDKDKVAPEEEDYGQQDQDGEEEEEEEEKEPKNVVTLEYPATETVWEHDSTKLTVKVDWTAVLDRLVGTDCLHGYPSVPQGCSIDYRYGIIYE